jgi:uncharacterized membrane protein
MKKKKENNIWVLRIRSILCNFKFWLAVAIGYFIFISSIYAIMSLVKHSHYDTFADLGIFNQGVWQLSRFKWPMSTFHLNKPFFGDHFDPILIVLVPFYWIYSSEKTLLFLQPFIILSAMIPLFLIGYRLTKSIFFSLSILLAYSFFIPLQYTIFYDFHDIIFLPPLFAWAYYFLITNRRKLVTLFLILLLLTKEEVGFFVATFGLYILIFHRKWRIYGFIWLVLGAVYSLIVMHFIIPAIGGNYVYFNYGKSGSTPTEVLFNFLKNPIYFISLFYDHPVKIETLKQTFWPFAYLPLFSPVGILLSLEQFASRFLDYRNVVRWTVGYHYSAAMTIVVAIGTIWSVNFYTKFIPRYRKILIIIVSVIIITLTRIEQINRSAVLLVKHSQFWARDTWMDYIDKAITLIPDDVPVSAQNNLIPHLSTRKNVYSLNDMNKAEYILVDFHKGQSGYNFFSDKKWQQVEKEIKSGIEDGKYKIIFHEKEVYLIKQT